MLEKYIKLWVGSPKGVSPVIRLSQYDTDWKLIFTVYNGDELWEIPGGAEAVLIGRNSDGSVFAVNGTITDNAIEIVITDPVSVCTGRTNCELRLADSDEKIIGTGNFDLIVEESPLSRYRLPTDDFDALNQLVNKALIAAQSAGEADEAVNAIRSAVSGPLKAELVADMTDHDKVYVYTGSEIGMTAGDWYYYDGSGWQDGGVYNAVAINTDKTLSNSGQAADARVTGDVRDKVNDIYGIVEANLAHPEKFTDNEGWQQASDGSYYGTLGSAVFHSTATIFSGISFKTGTQYTISFKIKAAQVYGTGAGAGLWLRYTTDSSSQKRVGVNRNQTEWATVTYTSTQGETVRSISIGTNGGTADVWYIKDLLVIEGAAPTPTAIDRVARQSISEQSDTLMNIIALQPTGDTTDRAAEIEAMLNSNGYCRLGAGDYYVSRIFMPAATTLEGAGDATKIYMIDGQYGAAVNMEDHCSVRNLTLLGAAQDITVTDVIATETEPENIWPGPSQIDVSSSAGYLHVLLDSPIPAGEYKLQAAIDRTGDAMCYIGFSTSQSTAIGSSSIVASALVSSTWGNSAVSVIIPQTVYSLRVCSGPSTTAGKGHSATWSSIRLKQESERIGILWWKVGSQYGEVSGCRISRFKTAGVLMRDTSSSVESGMSISNCFISDCGIGVYLQRNSEFSHVTNCVINSCWYGYLSRCGNSYVSNSGLDRNKVNVRIDHAEGSNPGHGAISNCSLHHAGTYNATTGQGKVGYGLIIKDTGLYSVIGCNIGYSKVLIKNSYGNSIAGCVFLRRAALAIIGSSSGSGSTTIANCLLQADVPVSVLSNDQSHIINNYRYTGAEVITIDTLDKTATNPANWLADDFYPDDGGDVEA